jgi:hypothetical protein
MGRSDGIPRAGFGEQVSASNPRQRPWMKEQAAVPHGPRGLVQEDNVPDAVLVEIAAALAAKATESLYDFVKDRFRGREQALAVLEAADGTAPESPQVLALADELQTAADYDPAFAEQLRAQWAAIQSGATAAGSGAVANSISGTVHGPVIQARDINGGITFH